jgi:hypothetical protein
MDLQVTPSSGPASTVGGCSLELTP